MRVPLDPDSIWAQMGMEGTQTDPCDFQPVPCVTLHLDSSTNGGVRCCCLQLPPEPTCCCGHPPSIPAVSFPSNPLLVLQFLHSRGQKELSMQMVQTMRIGLKDQNKGLFSIWQEIFQLPKVQR